MPIHPRMNEIRVSPDGARLLALARGERQPRPFAYRWLWPRLLGPNPRRWVWSSRLAMAACSLLAVAYCHTWYALPIPITLSGLNLSLRLPVLVDLPATAFALGAAVCVQHHWWAAAVAFSLVAGMVKETGPVFAALWAWNPICLVGFLAPAVRSLWKPGVETMTGPAAEALARPWRSSWAAHRGRWLDPSLWVLPWGVLLVGASRPSWQIGAVLVVAYGQVLVATDSVRLYCWAWPVLLAQTFHVVEPRWWLLLVVVAVAWPFGGNGI